jgi:hypothetical protein
MFFLLYFVVGELHVQVVSVSEVGVDIDIGPGCLAQAGQDEKLQQNSSNVYLHNGIAGSQRPTSTHA